MSDSTAVIGAGESVATAWRNQQEQVINLAAFWTGGVMYGMLIILFAQAVRVMTRNSAEKGSSSWIFLAALVLMFLLNTIYFGMNIHRFIAAYAQYQSPVPNEPIKYFTLFAKWDNFMYPVIQGLVTWIADALVIYRCYIVWKRNVWVIILPCLLLALCFTNQTIVMFWLQNPDKMAFKAASPFFTMLYPINLAQNIITTGLIAFRIWRARALAQQSGLRREVGLDLIIVIRIVVESALIYTVQQLIVWILYLVDHPAQLIFHGTMLPTIALVFALMAIRTEGVRLGSSGYPHGSHGMSSRGPSIVRPPITVLTSVTTNRDVDYGNKHSVSVKMDVFQHSVSEEGSSRDAKV